MNWISQLRWRISNVPLRRAESDFERAINVASLPGSGWTVIDERAWKPGRSKPTGPLGPGVALHTMFVVGSTVTLLAASGLTGSWSWNELHAVADAQAGCL